MFAWSAGAGATALRPKAAPGRARSPRSFLFLQGPASRFLERVARALVARGHRVHRINLNLGDRLCWRLPADDFRGHADDWPAFVGAVIAKRGVTDLVVHGDRRPYHVAAAGTARAAGARVWATDLGYLRPGWLTLEQDGLTRHSRLPRDPDAISALAAEFPNPDLTPGASTPFALLAALDIVYNAATVLGRPLYPHYRRHGLHHPFAEYAGWIGNAPRRLAARNAMHRVKAALSEAPGSYFLFPLQLATDFQIRANSDFSDLRDAVRLVMRSFARSAGWRRLAVVGHPLDEGLIDWRRLVAGDNVLFLGGGTPPALLANAAGVVTVNSTIGIEALRHGVPVKTLGDAVYDIAGLTHPGALDEFWLDPRPPDPVLLDAFLRVLVGATQIRGDYYTRAGQAAAVPAFVARLENGPYALSPGSLISARHHR